MRSGYSPFFAVLACIAYKIYLIISINSALFRSVAIPFGVGTANCDVSFILKL
jgi:hypothetical protein